MAKLLFDQEGKRLYETGVSKGVLFVKNENGTYRKGVAFDGLINFNHSPEGAEAEKFYADNIAYLTLRTNEEFKASMTVYSTPDEFDECDGTLTLVPGVKLRGQTRKPFGFAYISKIGNDTMFDDFSEKLHLVYGCTVSPSEEEHNTINDSVEPQEFSFDIDSTPIKLEGYKPLSVIEFEKHKLTTEQWDNIINITYGTNDTYKKTEDTEVQEGKDYYVRSSTEPYEYTKVTNPSTSDIGNYYEVDVPGLEPRLLLPSDVISMFPPVSG